MTTKQEYVESVYALAFSIWWSSDKVPEFYPLRGIKGKLSVMQRVFNIQTLPSKNPARVSALVELMALLRNVGAIGLSSTEMEPFQDIRNLMLK